jgi:CelD/BcsL family acetyltransferase involved in cellulose biosynthesis
MGGPGDRPFRTKPDASGRRDPSGLCLELHDSAEDVADMWDDLADRLGAPPFLRPGWIRAWARAFGSAELRALAAYRGAELAAILPFCHRRGVLTAPVNWHTPLFSFLAVDDEARAAVAEHIVSHAHVRIDLGFLDAEDPTVAACQAAAERFCRPTLSRIVMRSPYVQVAGRGWDEYEQSLSRKFRKELSRMQRRLDELGSVTFELTCAGPSELESLLSDGLRLESSGWKREQGTAITSSPQTLAFYEAIARWCTDRGWLRMAFLRLDGRAIAFDLCLEKARVMYVLKGGYDPDYRRFGPGALLTLASLRHAFRHQLESYELLGDDAPYKLEWTQTVRERVRFQAFSQSLAGRLDHMAWSHGRPAVHRLRAAIGSTRA